MKFKHWLPAVALSAVTGLVGAQNFPVKPIRLIVPVAAGGPVDLITRPFAEKMSEQLGQPMLVENMGGAGTLIGSDHVAKSAPDGYTLLVTTVAITILPSSYPKLPFDLVRDLTGVSVMSKGTIVVVVDPKLPIRNIKDMVAYAKANPAKLTFGSTGIGGSLYLAGELMKMSAGIDMTHIPYKGAAPALTDIMGSHLSLIFVSMAAVLPLSNAGKVRPIAVASLARSPVMPDIPTVAESGYPGFEVTAGNGVLAPSKTPRAVINHLNQAMVKVLASPDIKERFAKSGVDAISGTPEEFTTDIRNEITRWAKVVKAINFVQQE